MKNYERMMISKVDMGNALADFREKGRSSLNSVRKGGLENLRVLGFYGD